LIEKDSMMYGGTCINVGCIPSKSLVRSSGIAALNPEAAWSEKKAGYKAAIDEKRRVTGMLRKKNYDKLNDLSNVDIYDGKASFITNTKVSVALTDGETVELEAEKIFINTGSTSVVPRIEGLEGNPYTYYSNEMLELEELPEHLAIIGGGYIGLEFASMYAGFGSKVTVIQDGDVFIPREERDVADAVQQALEQRGVSFLLGAATKKIDGGSIILDYQGKEQIVDADAILIATGRRPNTDDLACDKAGVELSNRGAVVVDAMLKTTAPNIWAMGDVTGGLQFTYTSLDDFRIVWSGLHGGNYNRDVRKAVPYSVFITPSLSRVGIGEEEAVAAGHEIKVFKLPAAAVPKAQVLKNPVGILKAIVDVKTKQILGASLFCEESYEMINTVKLAMDAGLSYEVLRDQVFTHPTMSEALNDLFAG
jgi:Pyruvate/2-oxoglutarate dehydrogenase complex, dihydrolipoamide dehydrogenase (E3) component, and related enzymes